ncbi:hypothetical protein AMJ80_02215 [bacterium SM23_31]|nr:MAG: hypothetical protein AMJ80_02215 [bacterium SM23_31]
MNCKDFWTQYENSGLNIELEKHLEGCESCRNELKIETLLHEKVSALPGYKAPDGLWKKVRESLTTSQIPDTQKESILSKIGYFVDDVLSPLKVIFLKPAFVGAASVLLIAALSYYFLYPLSVEEKISRLARSEKPLLDTENQYAAEIAKYTELVETKKDNIPKDMYMSYQEKVAFLNDYVSECKDALSENKYNYNARKYLLLAYAEIVSTMKELNNKA